jgi:hypothetical protein
LKGFAEDSGWFFVGLAIGAVAVWFYSQVQSGTSAITGLQSQLQSDETQVQSFLQTPVAGVQNPTAKQIAISKAMDPLGN